MYVRQYCAEIDEAARNRMELIVRSLAEQNGVTARDGVFAGGDAVTGAATVILAMGAGKAGAKSIDEYIKSKK